MNTHETRIASQIRECLSTALEEMDALSALLEGEVDLRDDSRRQEAEV